MKVIFPPGQRSNYFDRNAVTKAISGATSTGPGSAPTIRWTYTVPAAKKYALNTLACRNVRQDIGTVTAAQTFIAVTPAGGAITNLCTLSNYALERGAVGQADFSGGLVFMTGAVITANTSDNSATGNTEHNYSMTGLEFDA